MTLIKIGFYSFMVLAGLYISIDVSGDIVVDLVMRGIANG